MYNCQKWPPFTLTHTVPCDALSSLLSLLSPLQGCFPSSLTFPLPLSHWNQKALGCTPCFAYEYYILWRRDQPGRRSELKARESTGIRGLSKAPRGFLPKRGKGGYRFSNSGIPHLPWDFLTHSLTSDPFNLGFLLPMLSSTLPSPPS